MHVESKQYARSMAGGVITCLHLQQAVVLWHSLCGKLQTVQWVDVSMPHSRKRRLIDHSKLVKLPEADPNCTATFENNLIDTYYLTGPFTWRISVSMTLLPSTPRTVYVRMVIQSIAY